MVSYKSKYLIIMFSALFPFIGFWHMNLMNVLHDYLPMSTTQIDFLAASYVYADAVFLLPVGLLLDKYAVDRLLLCGLLIFNLGVLIFALTDNFIIILVSRIISGIGHAFALMCCFRLVKNLIPDNRYTSVTGLVLTLAFCGGFMAQIPTVILLKYTNWHGVLWIMLILGIVVFLLLLLKLDNLPKAVVCDSVELIVPLWHSWLNWRNWLCSFFILTQDIPIMIFGALNGILFLQHKQINIDDGSSIIAAIYVGTILGSICLSYLSDRIKQTNKLVIVCNITVIMLLLYAIICSKLGIMACFIIFGLCGFFSSIQGIGYALVLKFNSKACIGGAMSVVNILLMFEIGSLQIVFSLLYDRYIDVAFYLLPLLIFCGGCVGVYLNSEMCKRHLN